MVLHIFVPTVTLAENVSLLLWEFAVFTETLSAVVLLMIYVFADFTYSCRDFHLESLRD